jgi:prepilin-type N-terminal cleavage/methylation domain-containing protein
MMRASRKGFTLIELLIAIVIVGILATMAVQTFWRARDQGLEASMESDLRTAAVQQEFYYAGRYTYADVADSLPHFNTSPGVTLNITYAAPGGWAGVVTHSSILTIECGLMIGDAPTGSAGPATDAGVVRCDG